MFFQHLTMTNGGVKNDIWGGLTMTNGGVKSHIAKSDV